MHHLKHILLGVFPTLLLSTKAIDLCITSRSITHNLRDLVGCHLGGNIIGENDIGCECRCAWQRGSGGGGGSMGVVVVCLLRVVTKAGRVKV